MKRILLSMLLSLVFIIWGFEVGANPWFVLDLCIWICMMISAYMDIEREFYKFAFGLTLFTFLMGREFLEQYSLHSIEKDFSSTANEHLSISLLYALLSFWIAFSIFNKKRRYLYRNISTNFHVRNIAIRRYSKALFYISLPFAFVSTIAMSLLVYTVGYQNSYIAVSTMYGNNLLLYVCDKIGIMMAPCFCIYAATQPSKRNLYKVGRWYLLYSFLTLFEGSRGTFLTNILVFGSVLAFMQIMQPNERWFDKKKYLHWSIIGLPLVIVASVAIHIGRSGEKVTTMELRDSFTDFFYQQGVTGVNIKRAFEMQSVLPKPISGYYTLKFLYTGIPARLLGNKVYSGHNESHALRGNSMDDALSYTVMGTAYIEGAGTGSSYIMEAYYDFGYIGIVIGSVLYAFLFSLLHLSSPSNIFGRSLTFIVCGELLWAPRAAFTDFLSNLFAPTILFSIVLIFFLAQRKKTNIVAKYN